MTQLTNSTMFTDDRISSQPSNLIQQAFQGVEDEEDHQNNFVAYIESDENGSQMLRLSPEAAAQFGINVNVEGGISGEVTFLQNDGEIVSENQPELNTENISNAACTRYDEWPVQNMNQGETFQQNTIGSNLSMDTIDLSNAENCTQNTSSLLQHSNDLMQVDSVLQDNIATFDKPQITNGENCMQYTLLEDQSSQAQSFVTVTNSQGQILQSLPVMLPSTQYSLQPLQPVTKSTKNVRILPSTSKITVPGNNVHTVSNGGTSNAVIFSNATLLNTVSPQVIKALPISAQFLNSNGIVNASDLLSGACEISSQSVNRAISDSISNGTTTITSNLINGQLPQFLKVNPSSLQAGNIQQILTSVVKSTNPTSATLKTTPVFTTSNVKTSLNNYRKAAQGVNQVLRVAAAHVKTSASKSAQKITSALVLQNPSQVKVQEIKNVTNPTSVLRTSSCVSVLKQQPKANFAKKVNLQSLHNISNNVQNLQKSVSVKQNTIERNMEKSPITLKLQEHPNQIKAVKCFKNIKPMPGRVIEKYRGQSLCAIKPSTLKPVMNPVTSNSTVFPSSSKVSLINSVSPTSKCILYPSASKSNPVLSTSKNYSAQQMNSTSMSSEFVKTDISKHDSTKPLGTPKNPIPIVPQSQGKTFVIDENVPSSQINEIIEKYNRERQNFEHLNGKTTGSTGKVVFKVVYPTDLDFVDQNVPTAEKRPAKRGRPKKSAAKSPILPPKPVPEEDKELKNERKKVVARTRSGRLSRPPKHMVRDYKHLHPIDFTQPDLDDSDGGYSDYNTNGDILEDDESPKELLTGLEVPKRKVSKEYICPTCTKTYLGREKMIIHFEKNPSHGSIEQLPPPKPKSELNQISLDTLKRKGKKRGPWGTPEEKSARRQEKLQSAITVCEKNEICNIAAKPVLDAMSLYDLMVLKSENNVMNFMKELKGLMEKVREKSGSLLALARNEERNSADSIDLNDDLLCDALGLNPGLYKVNSNGFRKEELSGDEEPVVKKMKSENGGEEEPNLEERTSSGFSEGSDISSSSNCPDVLTALTLMPRNSTPTEEPCKLSGSKLVISNTEIQSELCENSGFRKIDISTNNVSCKKMDSPIAVESDPTFIKFQSPDKRFIKMENEMDSFHNQSDETFGEIQSFESASDNFNKSFQNSAESNSSIFEGLENLEVKINYDQLANLGMLNGAGEMEQSHMTEQIEQIVSEKLDEMIPRDLLENNLMSNNSMAPDISFAFGNSLAEEYSFRNIRS